MVNCVSVLGSTGSVGRQTLDIVEHLQVPVAALTAGTNVERMARQEVQLSRKIARGLAGIPGVGVLEQGKGQECRGGADPALPAPWLSPGSCG